MLLVRIAPWIAEKLFESTAQIGLERAKLLQRMLGIFVGIETGHERDRTWPERGRDWLKRSPTECIAAWACLLVPELHACRT